MSADHSARHTSPGATGKRPTLKLQATSSSRPAQAAANQSGKARPRDDHRGATPVSPSSCATCFVAGRLVIEAPVELHHLALQVVAEELRVEDFREPQQADHAVGAGRIVEPAEGQVRREIDALVAHRGDGIPHRQLPHLAIEIRVVGDDDLRIPEDDLLQAHVGEAAALAAGHVVGAEEFDHLHVDGAREPGGEPLGAARVVDARALVLRHRRDLLLQLDR